MSRTTRHSSDATAAIVARAVLVFASVVVCLDCAFGPSPDEWNVWGRTESEGHAARQLRESGPTVSKVAGCCFAVACVSLALLPPADRRGRADGRETERRSARASNERNRPGDTAPGRFWKVLNRPLSCAPLVRLFRRRPR